MSRILNRALSFIVGVSLVMDVMPSYAWAIPHSAQKTISKDPVVTSFETSAVPPPWVVAYIGNRRDAVKTRVALSHGRPRRRALLQRVLPIVVSALLPSGGVIAQKASSPLAAATLHDLHHWDPIAEQRVSDIAGASLSPDLQKALRKDNLSIKLLWAMSQKADSVRLRADALRVLIQLHQAQAVVAVPVLFEASFDPSDDEQIVDNQMERRESLKKLLRRLDAPARRHAAEQVVARLRIFIAEGLDEGTPESADQFAGMARYNQSVQAVLGDFFRDPKDPMTRSLLLLNAQVERARKGSLTHLDLREATRIEQPKIPQGLPAAPPAVVLSPEPIYLDLSESPSTAKKSVEEKKGDPQPIAFLLLTLIPVTGVLVGATMRHPSVRRTLAGAAGAVLGLFISLRIPRTPDLWVVLAVEVSAAALAMLMSWSTSQWRQSSLKRSA